MSEKGTSHLPLFASKTYLFFLPELTFTVGLSCPVDPVGLTCCTLPLFSIKSLSFLGLPPWVLERSVRLVDVSVSLAQIDRKRVLGHLSGQDAVRGTQGADVAVHGRVQADGGTGRRVRIAGSSKLLSAGVGLRRGFGVANAGLGHEDVGVGQRLREDGEALRSAAQGGELALAEALFVGLDALFHGEVGAGSWVGVDGQTLHSRCDFGESLLHGQVELIGLRGEDVGLPMQAIVLHAGFKLLENGEGVAMA